MAGLAVAGAVTLAMAPANAEASNTTTTLTLTGMVSSTCDLGTGGKVSYVAPGGTMTLKASLAGASVNIPGFLGKSTNVFLDSSQIASFVDTVIIDGDKKHPQTLTSPTDKIVLKNVQGTHKIEWTATAVNLLPGVLGVITVPLSGDNVGLPAGGDLSWSGKIVASSNTDCGIAVSVPTTKVHVGSATVTVPGVDVSLPNPIPSVTKVLGNLPGVPGLGGKSSSKPAAGGKQSTTKYTPPALTVPEQVMPRAVNFGGGGGGFAAPGNDGGAGSGGGYVAPGNSVTSTAAPEPTGTAAEKVQPAEKTVDVAQRSQLGGAQLPVLLAILAILALVAVTGMYAKMYLLRRNV